MLFSCLKYWSFDDRRGLPQNRDASSVLANLYLRSVDIKMRLRHADTYFRYMDDIKIVCRDKYDARRSLKELILVLRDIGLSINSKKTEICPGHDTDTVARLINDGSPAVQRLENMWRSRSHDVIYRSIRDLRDYTLLLIRQGSVDSRDFRYCINRLELLARCKEFYVPSDAYDAITPNIIDSIYTFPASTATFVKYLRVVDIPPEKCQEIGSFIMDEEKAIYSWQNYLLWALLVEKKYRNQDLMSYVLNVIEQGKDNPHCAGAVLYAGACGNTESRKIIARRFANIKSFVGQRAALIAIHELPFQPDVETFP